MPTNDIKTKNSFCVLTKCQEQGVTLVIIPSLPPQKKKKLSIRLDFD